MTPEETGLAGAFTPTSLNRLLGTHADFLSTLNDREKQHHQFSGEYQVRYLGLLDELRRLHELLRKKDEEISDLERKDRDLKGEEIKAKIEEAKIVARQKATEHLLDVLESFARQLPAMAAAARRYTSEDESYAEALWQATGALFHKLKTHPEVFEMMLQIAPTELQQLAGVLKSYADHKGYKGVAQP